MKKVCCFLLTLTLATLLLPATAEPVQFKRPIRFVVGNPPGGGQDTIARLVSVRLAEILSTAVIVDNRPGAAGNIGAELVSRAPADGHTLLMIGFANTTNVGLFKKLPFDLVRDFSPVALIGESTNFLIVPAASPVGTIGDLIAAAKARRAKLNYGSGGNGTAPHLGTELFKRMAGIDIVHIPYKGGGLSMQALVMGEIDMLIANPLAALPQVKSGRAKALAVTSLKRSGAAPSVPTVAESGLPGYEVISWWGVVAPAGLAKAKVDRLNESIVESLQHPDIKSRLDSQGIERGASDPQALGAFMQQEVKKWSAVIRSAGIEPI